MPLRHPVATPYDFTSHLIEEVKSLWSHLSFAKEPYKRDGILQKRPVI